MNRADTHGCVDTHPPECQLREKKDFEMDTDIIPEGLDKHQLQCQNYSEDKPWSPGFRSEKPCDTGRASWLETHRRVRA